MALTPRATHFPRGINGSGGTNRPAGYGGSHASTAARTTTFVPMASARDERGDGWTAPSNQINHTGTTVVAVTADDATVLGADRRASLGGRFISNKDVDKIHRVHPTAALALSGAVSHLQQLTELLRAETSLYEMRRGESMSVTALSTLLSNVLRSAPLVVAPILGGVDADGPRVFTHDPGGGEMEDRYAAAGSGMQLAYGALEGDYEDGLTRAEAAALVARSVEAASERDTASGDGITLATVTAEGTDIARHEAADAVG